MPNNISAIGQKSIAIHRKLSGKIEVVGKRAVKTMKDLSLFYTPGVGAVSSYVAKNPQEASALTFKKNSVAVVSDGSAVLGLGNLGPFGALPVMEGKAMLFKAFANIDAVPIVLNTQDTEKIIAAVVAISPTFGGINLEDISAPRCFEIEERLKKILDIPVLHDDQHGTAIVVTAGLLNALRVVKKTLLKARIVILGAGAAGSAVADLLLSAGARDVVILDSHGILSRGRHGLNLHKESVAKRTNPRNLSGDLAVAIKGADVFIGVSAANALPPALVREMAPRAIVFALANPVPEIMPLEAYKAGAMVVATGRSDFPNQLNNVLGFPGIFRGALDHGVKHITTVMEVRAAKALAHLVSKPTTNMIIPSAFDKRVVSTVARAIR